MILEWRRMPTLLVQWYEQNNKVTTISETERRR